MANKELRCLGNSYSPPWHQLIPHLLLCQPLGFALQTHRAGRAVGKAAADMSKRRIFRISCRKKLVPCSACNESVSESTGSRNTTKLFFRKDGLSEKRLLVAAETSICLSTSTPVLKSSVARRAAQIIHHKHLGHFRVFHTASKNHSGEIPPLPKLPVIQTAVCHQSQSKWFLSDNDYKLTSRGKNLTANFILIK